MERERARDKEAIRNTQYEQVVKDREEWVQKKLYGKVVVKSEEREFQETRQGKVKFYFHPTVFTDTALDNWSIFVQDIRRQSGRHRHQGGLVIYVIEGEGASEVNGKIDYWKAGDLLLLPILPYGVKHQHWNRDNSKGCRWVAFVYRPMTNLTFHYLEQLEESPDLFGSESSNEAIFRKESEENGRWKSKVSGEQEPLITDPDQLASENLFDKLLKIRDHARGRQKDSISLVRGEELPWELNQHGKMQWFMHPSIAYTCIQNLIFYRQEIPVGSRSGLQRHPGEKVFYILQGKGYTEMNGVKFHWQADDIMTLPLREEGITYRHVNTGTEPVQLLGCEPNVAASNGLDRDAHFEELQPCPEFRERRYG